MRIYNCKTFISTFVIGLGCTDNDLNDYIQFLKLSRALLNNNN